MKIYLLRHEKRYDNHNFDTDLTQDGFNNAEKLKLELDKLNIDEIYVSPYKRVIQTIEPYLNLSNNRSSPKFINLEYGIYESLHNDKDFKNIRGLNDNLYGLKYFNKDYTSLIDKDDLKIGETYVNIRERANKFINYLLQNNNNKNILVVCHLSVINAILNRDERAEFEMGKLILFYDQ